MLLKDMTINQEVWCKHPDKKEYYFGTIKKIAHRPRVELNQLGQHGRTIFPYAQEIYLKEEFTWCDECDGDGYVNYSCCGDNMKGNDYGLCPTCKERWGDEADFHEDCESCEGKGVITTKTIKI